MKQPNFIFQDVEDLGSRLDLIRDNCDEVIPKYSYMRKFTDEEIDEYKSNLSDDSVEIDTLKDELEDIKKDYKAKMKPKEKRLKFLLKCLREKAISATEECYAMKNETHYCIYNSQGELIFSRLLRPAEKQKTIFMAQREGTNN
jgi:predicted RNase H-like nuclease (RuvC/YqgF family)